MNTRRGRPISRGAFVQLTVPGGLDYNFSSNKKEAGP